MAPTTGKRSQDAGWSRLVDEVRSRWQDGDRNEAYAAVSDDLLDDLVVAGTPVKARNQFERFEAVEGVDAIQRGFFGGMDEEERRTTLTELAPGRY